MATSINEGFINNSKIVSASYVKITGLSPKKITKFRDYRSKEVKNKMNLRNMYKNNVNNLCENVNP